MAGDSKKRINAYAAIIIDKNEAYADSEHIVVYNKSIYKLCGVNGEEVDKNGNAIE